MDTLAQLKAQRQVLFDQFKQDLQVNKLTKACCDLTDRQLMIAWQESGLDNLSLIHI